jgi:hypothetical protein
MNLTLSSKKKGLRGVCHFFPCVPSHHRWCLRCDERFVGYGGNKAACLFEMYLSGISFFVLTDHFIIHQNHLYEETTRKAEVGLDNPSGLLDLRLVEEIQQEGVCGF